MISMPLLTGKVAVVTGASSGIGRAIAVLYAGEGATVVLASRNEDNGRVVAGEILAAGGDAVFIKTDVSSERDCERLVKETVRLYGRLDIACNNAGTMGPAKPVGRLSADDWRHVMDVNLHGVFYCMHYEINSMLPHNSGAIINIGSIASQVGFKNLGAYAAAKHGLLGLTKTAALEYAENGIRINAIGPGTIDTPMARSYTSPDKYAQFRKVYPVKRYGLPEEVAGLALWLASDYASFVTGAFIPVDGGYTAQ